MTDTQAGQAAEAPEGRHLVKVAGPMLLWGIGVGAVISGDYYGWNSGLGATGYWGYLIALAVMGVMYAGLSSVIAELGTAIPHSGGAYAYVVTALGRLPGFLAGVSVLMQFLFGPVAVALTVGAYVQVLFPSVPVLVSAGVMYVASIGVHLFGTGDSLKVGFVLTAIALLGLALYIGFGLPQIDVGMLNSHSDGAVLGNGMSGLWATLPMAAWFFFAIESLGMTAEETRNPKRDLPRALILSFITLAVIAFGTVTVTAGVAGPEISDSVAPLSDALGTIVGDQGWIVPTIAIFAIVSIVASFHACVVAYSRQTFALSRAGYLPPVLSKLNKRNAPSMALIVPGAIGFVLVVLCDRWLPNAVPTLVYAAVFGATTSYILMILSAIVLRKRRPDMERPVKAFGGMPMMAISLILAIILLPAALVSAPVAFFVGVGLLAAFAAYYLLAARQRVQNRTVDEELALVAAADAEVG